MSVREIQPEGLILPSGLLANPDSLALQQPLNSFSVSPDIWWNLDPRPGVCVAPTAAFMAACPAESQAAPARDQLFRHSGAMIPGGFDI